MLISRLGRIPLMLLALVLAAAGGALTACTPPVPNVVYYGDSLAHEAYGAFNMAIAGNNKATVTRKTYPGTAPCDWFSDVPKTAATNPAAVVLSFSGNALTSCMTSRVGTSATAAQIAAVYVQDLGKIAVQFPQAKVYLSTSPQARVYGPGPSSSSATSGPIANGGPELDGAMQTVAVTHSNTKLDDAGPAVENALHAYTPTLPCLVWEGASQGCSGGQIAVRARDGLHFCPTATGSSVDGGCAVYASGAVRFGFTQATPVASDLHL